MRNIFFILTIVTGVSNYGAIAQKLSPGYVINLQNDTLKGFILDGTDAELAVKVEFRKEQLTSEVTSYTPADLLGLGFAYGRIFQQFRVHGTTNSNDSVVTVFAKRVIEGKVSLYTYDKLETNQPDIFLKNNYSNRIVHLAEPKNQVITNENGKQWNGKSNRHLGLLNIVKGDSLANYETSTKIEYTERSIKKDILKYNHLFEKDFPVMQYKRQTDHCHEITIGIPINKLGEDAAFRAALYRHKFFPEKSRKMSLIQGVSYRYWSSNKAFDSNVENSNLNYRQQILTVIPFGVSYQSAAKFVRPYIYVGIGLGLFISTDHHVVKYVDHGSTTSFSPTIMVNTGAGVKVKVGSKFIIAELTPTFNRSGIFLNLGYSF